MRQGAPETKGVTQIHQIWLPLCPCRAALASQTLPLDSPLLTRRTCCGGACFAPGAGSRTQALSWCWPFSSNTLCTFGFTFPSTRVGRGRAAAGLQPSGLTVVASGLALGASSKGKGAELAPANPSILYPSLRADGLGVIRGKAAARGGETG